LKHHNKELGKQGEDIAYAYLVGKGYSIVETNYRYKRNEVDIIAQDKDEIVFIEVKTRSSSSYGKPEDFVSPAQQKRLIDCAHHYLLHTNVSRSVRFDIIAISWQANEPTLEHLENAFWPMA